MHIESYSLNLTGGKQKKTKAGNHTVRSIVSEASREPGNVSHIDEPRPPVYLYGKPLEDLEGICREWASNSVDASGKRLRKDALCLIGGVFSAPDGTSPEAWSNIKNDAMRWLRKRYGDRLQCVVEHIDESHPHVHFYAVPLPGERFDAIHDGKRAAAELGNKSKKGDRNKAYRAAMRAFQDDYYNDVGAPNGMTRLGPRRRRLTREEWRLEQVQAEAICQKMQQADHMLSQAAGALDGAGMAVEALRREAKADIQQMKQKAQLAADLAQDEARRKGNEEGRYEAVAAFGKSSLWARLAGLLGRRDAQIKELKASNEVLRQSLKNSRKEIKSTKALLESFKSAGRRIAEQFLGMRRERDDALNQASILERQRDYARNEANLMRSREINYDEVLAQRDLHRARADQLERQVALLEAPLRPQDAVTPPSRKLTHVELGHTT